MIAPSPTIPTNLQRSIVAVASPAAITSERAPAVDAFVNTFTKLQPLKVKVAPLVAVIALPTNSAPSITTTPVPFISRAAVVASALNPLFVRFSSPDTSTVAPSM